MPDKPKIGERVQDIGRWLNPPIMLCNEVVDQMLPHLTGAELKVLLFIWRVTRGLLDIPLVSLSELCDGVPDLNVGTGLSTEEATVAVKTLIEKGLVRAHRPWRDGCFQLVGYSLTPFRGEEEYEEAARHHNSSPQRINSKQKSKLQRVREELGVKCGWVCVYCQRTGNEKLGPDGRGWHVDHLHPKTLGGDNQRDNLVLACAACNIKKSSLTIHEFYADRNAG